MFHSRKGSHDVKRANSRFIDPRKDAHTRFRALKTLLDQLPLIEVKSLFQRHYIEIYYVFYEEFNAFLAASKSKGHKSLKDELEGLLLILEKFLLLVPEKVHERWQFNSIGSILRRLLHHGNIVSVREIGIKLYLLWLQDLQDNVDELALLAYGSIVPHFPSALSKIDMSKIYRPSKYVHSIASSISGTGYMSMSSSQFLSYLDVESEWCLAESLTPLLPPPQGEKNPLPEELTNRFLDRILDYMTKKMMDVNWKDVHMRESGFFYLFQHFKRFYLPHIFPNWNPTDRLFIKSDELLQTNLDMKLGEISQNKMSCCWRVLCWFAAFTSRFKKPRRKSADQISESSNTDDSFNTESSSCSSADDSNIAQYQTLYNTAEVVRYVLYSTKENVICLHEVFRQGFMMPLGWSDIICRVMTVYHEWLKPQERPIFMQENFHPEDYLTSIINREFTLAHDDRSPLLRTSSYKEAVVNMDQGFFPKIPVENVRAGLQVNIRLFIANSCHVFFSNTGSELLQKQADVCRKVMKMYRNLVLELELEQQTWKQLLVVLLKVTDYTLKGRPPSPREKTLGGQLATYIFQTLFVTWIRASLQVTVPTYLWNELLRIMSSLTSWPEMISEWAGTVETLTRVLARTVYGIDLSDLPLERLTEQKRKKLRGKVTANSSHSSGSQRKSFSRGWSQYAKDESARESKQAATESEPAAVETEVGESNNRDTVHPDDGTSLTEPEATVPPPDVTNTGLGAETRPGRKLTLIEVASKSEENLSNIAEGIEASPDTTMVEVQPDDSLESTSEQPMEEHMIDPEYIRMERKLKRDGILSEVLESATEIFNRHQRGKTSISNVSLSSEDSYASTSFPYGDDVKIERSRSLTPSIASDRLSRDDLDQYCSSSVGNSTDNIVELPITVSTNQEAVNEDDVTESQIAIKPPDIISDHSSVTDPDLIAFDTNVELRSKVIGHDCQSIDSAAFTLLEGDTVGSFEVPKGKFMESTATLTSAESITSSCSTLVEDKMEVQHVTFAPDKSKDSVSRSCSVSSSNKSEQLERKDTLVDSPPCSSQGPSVIAGGNTEGWTPVSALILWRRIVGILGNVNKVKDQQIHAKVFEHLIDVWNMLHTVRQNQSISLDNRTTPPPPKLIPPLLFCSTWCFEAMSLSVASNHKPGRVLAYKLMCMMTVRRHDKNLSSEHLAHFYRLLHDGLTGSDQDVINSIISQCDSFYSMGFPGSTALVFDFIYAANTIITTQNLKHPRKEAVTLLGSLICFPNLYADMPIHQPGAILGSSQQMSTGQENLRERIITPALQAAKTDPSCHARCISINALGVFIIESLVNCNGHPKITDCLCVILSLLCFHNRIVSNVALDVVWSLSFFYEELKEFEALLPLKLIEALCLTALQLLLETKNTNADPSSDSLPEFITKLLLCILDWAMAIPKDQLSSTRRDPVDCTSYLALIFKTFKRAHNGYSPAKYLEKRRSLNINQVMLSDNRPIRLARVHDDVTIYHDESDNQKKGPAEEPGFMQDAIIEKRKDLIKKTAKYVLNQLVNFLGHFPFNTGAVRPQSQVMEYEDDPTSEAEELTPAIFDKDNVQLFLLNKSTLLSVVEINVENEDKVKSSLQTYSKYCRFILRDMTGKYCWDQSVLFSEEIPLDEPDMATSLLDWIRGSFRSKHLMTSGRPKGFDSSNIRLLTWDENSNFDRIDQMLYYVGNTSPECLVFPDQSLNVPAPVPEQITTDIQSSVVTSVLKQHNKEQNYVHEIKDDEKINASRIVAPNVKDSTCQFHLSRFFLHQLGYLTWEKRLEIDLLKQTTGLIRELKNLDNRPCRETHKFAVFYVGPGQEDKMSIMTNMAGSQSFEKFVSGMAWEIDPATHSGFMGGLERNLSTGSSVPYYASHDLEVIFHVSTRMPLDEGDSGIITKLRHLGNDEVHIVWSEHSRDFRRGIINMEFGDVIIIIYPLRNNLYRISIDRKPEIPMFGPLFDGAIVGGNILPALVRATAINAGRAKRAMMPLFERQYEERARNIHQISERHVESTTFETFSNHIFNPCRTCKSYAADVEDAPFFRTFSLPSRPPTGSDPTAMLKIMEAQTDKLHRIRASSTVHKPRERPTLSPPTSSTEEQQDQELEKPRERKRSLSKRFKSGSRTFSHVEPDDPSTT